MKYSFKRHLQNNDSVSLTLLISIVFGVFHIYYVIAFYSLVPEILAENFIMGLIILSLPTTLFLANSVYLLIVIYKEKRSLRDYSEVNARIDNVSTLSIIERFTFEGLLGKKGINVTFCFIVDNKKLEAIYYIRNNRHTFNYFDKYKEIGKTVSILFNSKNNHIKIEEEYM